MLFSTIAPQTLSAAPPQKQIVNALYIPLADHYAALVAYERYRDKMQHADFRIEQMKSWDLLRAHFNSGDVDMAFIMSPLAMEMYHNKPFFRWIGLMHRDGNALAINDLIKNKIQLPKLRADRKPDASIANALKEIRLTTGTPIPVGLPHLLATHTVVLYRYLKKHGITIDSASHSKADVFITTVPPPEAPAFIKAKSNRAEAAAFEQSLPWADVVETGNFGHVGWYSKDVMPWPNGHVECIAIATNTAITNKFSAIREVMGYIHQAGRDIEAARMAGGEELQQIIEIIIRHIPSHTPAAITASLDPHLRVINYQYLNIDKAGLKQIMDWAVEGKILDNSINIDEFADLRFNQADESNDNLGAADK
ncbi:MAG: ABC transporter substrate-binding protein [Pseudomonadales bacterium]|nr:ABC transporter substrate-binding protein [Pseudomonadales bacterium]